MGRTILVVEDDVDFRETIVDFLEAAGHTVLQAMQGKEALEILKVNKVDLVLSDIKMPVMGGLELLSEIQNLGPERPKVVMMTGYSVYTQEEALKAGAEALVDKPSIAKELLHILSSIRFY